MARRRKQRSAPSRGRSGPQEVRLRLEVSPRERATILAALRFHADENLQGRGPIPDKQARDIASGGGAFRPLDCREVKALCRRLKRARPSL